ncbi:MAG: YebC/PmpR family DNA-binding transcriptional regulator [bacterium]|nr:YebC/PmpR family DNA-binding transcriptional regulator [bacterium]
MSGHSKWSTIKRQKGVADAKRSSVFTKLANTISVAARQGGGDMTMNFSLRLAIDKAKQSNMPKENIERAVKRGTGELEGARIEEVMYEAYGPGGTGILVEAATDNRNRTSAEVKVIFNKFGGKLAEPGAVSYQFKKRGVLNFLLNDKDADEVELAAIEAGAEDFEQHGKELIVYSEPREIDKVRAAMIGAGFEPAEVSLSWEPSAMIKIEDEKMAGSILILMNALEELEDITSVSSNFDIPDQLMEKLV